MQLDYRDEHINSYDGQHDYELGLYIDDEIIGMVQYTLFEGELTVSDIIVRPEYRRKGFGSRMMQYIKKAHPEYEYKPSMMTDLGAKFKHKNTMNEIRGIIREVLSENLQLADKAYFTPGLLSAEVRRVMVSEKMTDGDVWTKLVTDIYMAYLEQSDRQSEMIGNAILNKDEKNEPYIRETDVLEAKEWKEIKELYGHLKTYNKNVFPISGFNINGVEDIWSLIRGLKQRATILEEFKKLPSVATRNMKEDIRTPRTGTAMNSYRDQLETFLAHYSQLGNRNPELQSIVHKKMFKKGVDLDGLMDFVKEKENLLGGATFDKSMIESIIENSDELEKVYEQGTVMVVKVDGPYGIKEIGCNSLWCFTYGQGYDRNWSQYSYNDVVYAIIDFSEDSDSPEFMYVLIKPVDWETEDEDENEEKIFDMKNDGYYDARNFLDSVFGREKAKELFTFDIEPEEEEEEEEEWEKEMNRNLQHQNNRDLEPEPEPVDPNQLSMFEVRRIVRKIIKESVLSETIETGFDAFHGAESKISKFSDSFLSGDKVIQHHGAGIYFTTNHENARMFGENVYTVRIDGNFIEKETPAESVNIDDLIALMKMSDEEWELEAQNYSEDPETGVMIAAQDAIHYADNEADVFLRVQSSWYQYQPLDYVRNMTKLGYDGMIVDAPRDFVGDKHIIVFNPEAVTLTGKI